MDEYDIYRNNFEAVRNEEWRQEDEEAEVYREDKEPADEDMAPEERLEENSND